MQFNFQQRCIVSNATAEPSAVPCLHTKRCCPNKPRQVPVAPWPSAGAGGPGASLKPSFPPSVHRWPPPQPVLRSTAGGRQATGICRPSGPGSATPHHRLRYTAVGGPPPPAPHAGRASRPRPAGGRWAAARSLLPASPNADVTAAAGVARPRPVRGEAASGASALAPAAPRRTPAAGLSRERGAGSVPGWWAPAGKAGAAAGTGLRRRPRTGLRAPLTPSLPPRSPAVLRLSAVFSPQRAAARARAPVEHCLRRGSCPPGSRRCRRRNRTSCPRRRQAPTAARPRAQLPPAPATSRWRSGAFPRRGHPPPPFPQPSPWLRGARRRAPAALPAARRQVPAMRDGAGGASPGRVGPRETMEGRARGRAGRPAPRREGGRRGRETARRRGWAFGWVGAAPSLRFPTSPPFAAHGPRAPCSFAGRRGDKRRPHRQVTSFIYHLRSGVTGGQGEPPSPPLARSGGPPSSCRTPQAEAYALKAQRSRWARYPLLASGLFLLSSLPGKPSHRLCFLLQRRACPRCKKQLPFLSSKAAQNFFFFFSGWGVVGGGFFSGSRCLF